MVKRKDFFHSHWLATGVSALIGLVLTSGAGWAANPDEQHSDVSKRLADSAKTLENVMASPKRAIPEGTLHHAVCVAIFPSTIQVAVLVGGKHGKGFATCRTGDGWSAPAPLDISGGSWGAQLGGQEIDLVLLVTDEKGMQELASGKLKMGIEASIAGGPVGGHAATVTTNADILSYSRTRGLFAGTNLNGSAITEDEADARTLYGSPLPLAEILAGRTQTPDAGRIFVNEVAKYAGQSRQKE
jgi:SH3 domain-containing YSC84-like protein 1